MIDENKPMANDTRDENTPAATSSSSGTTTRDFQNRWLNLYPWLSFNGTLMFCEWCKQKKIDNTFTTGTDNIRTSTLTRHLETAGHQATLAHKEDKVNMKKAIDNVFDKEEEASMVAMKIVFIMAKEGIHLTKYTNMISFFLRIWRSLMFHH